MNSERNWNVRIDDAIYKQLRKFPHPDRERILLVIGNPLFDPYKGDLEKIKGEEDTWRRRLGAYRIFYEVNQRSRFVLIFWVERRTSSTY